MSTDHEERTRELLRTSLSAAVPLWIAELKKLPWSEVQRRGQASAQIIAEKGDVILYRGKRKGESAAAFNGLAQGVAVGAFVPGGITVFGLHFEASHPDLEKKTP